jgi:hypothetical protein
MRLRKRVLIGVAVAMAATGIVPAAVYGGASAPTRTTEMSAVWAFQPQTMRQARDHAKAIVLAQVVSVRQGEDLVVPAAGEPDGMDRVPTQRVTVKVLQSFKGAAAPNQQLVLFQTGGAVTNAEGERVNMFLQGDPAYAAGQQYLLMLVPGPNGLLNTFSPEARFRHTSGGALTAMQTSKTAGEVKGKRLSDLTPLLTSTN